MCRWRHPDGRPTGGFEFRWLDPEQFGQKDKKGYDFRQMYGPHTKNGAAVIMLGKPNRAGELGIGEGLETVAGLGLWYRHFAKQLNPHAVHDDIGLWAAGDAGSVGKTAEWIDAFGALPEVRHLLIAVDAGGTGEGASLRLAHSARAAGIRVTLYYPGGDNDLADDWLNGKPPLVIPFDEFVGFPRRPTDAEPAPALPLIAGPSAASPALPNGAAPAAEGGEFLPPGAEPLGDAWAQGLPQAAPAIQPGSVEGVAARLMTLTKGISGDALTEGARAIADARLDPLNREAMINLMYRQTGIKKRTIEEMVRGQSSNSTNSDKPWLSKIAVNNDGSPKGIMSNVAVTLREAEEWQGCLWFDEFTQEIWFKKEPPYSRKASLPCERKWAGESDELGTTEWIQSVAGIHALKHVVFDAVVLVASEHKYDQLQDYLLSLVWDGVSRWDDFPITHLGYEHTGPINESDEEKEERKARNKYVWAAIKKWAIGAVARALHPGVKNDQIPIFVGDQGRRKSSGIRQLVGDDWFTDDISEFGTKDAAIQLYGKWVIELSELDSLRGAVLSRIKAFASRSVDHYRPPYGRKPIDVPRRCAFLGTVNEAEFLRDTTGNRRYWPIPISKTVDIKAIERDRDQLWAEAVHLYKQGEKWYFDDDTENDIIDAARIEQELRRQPDSWETPIENYLSGPMNDVSTDEIMVNALYITDRSKWGKGEEMRVGKIMQKLGWIRKLKRAPYDSKKRSWRYLRPPEAVTTSGDVSSPSPAMNDE